MAELTAENLEALRQLDTCTVANAIETFDVRPWNEGFMAPEIRSVFPGMGRMIGYAATAVIAADKPATTHMSVSRTDWFDEVVAVPGPRVAVIHDLDYPNPIGSFWGEVQSNVHKALGCVGTVTDGGVRDLDEMQELGFNAFARDVLVSHAYVHMVDISVPVTIGGLTVNPGDLLMGDKHGVVSIPHEIAAEVPLAAAAIGERERVTIELCQSPDFTVEKLKARILASTEKTPDH